jgi:hypothetical protein
VRGADTGKVELTQLSDCPSAPIETLRLFAIGPPPAVAIGTLLGLKLYGKLDEATFRTVVLVLLLLSGLHCCCLRG